METKEAIDKAVDEAIALNYLDGFFKKHKEGVVDMSLTEYNEAEFIENRKEEGRIEGRIEGRAEQIIEMGFDFGLSEGDILNRLQDKLNVSLQIAQEYLKTFGKSKA